MNDQSIIYLYLAQFVILIVFACGCVYRLWLNHIDRRQIRWALVSLASTLGFWAITIGYRTYARSVPALESRVVLNSWHFWMFEVLMTMSVIWLFFVLQKPRNLEREGR